VAGFMAKRQGGGTMPADAPAGGGMGGGLGDVLGGLLGGRGAGAGASQGGGLGGLLDMNGDGNALDDILRMAGRAMR
jgi:hypothetical protein